MQGSAHVHVILWITYETRMVGSVGTCSGEGHTFEDTIAGVVADIVVDSMWRWGNRTLDVWQIKTNKDKTKAAHYLAKVLRRTAAYAIGVEGHHVEKLRGQVTAKVARASSHGS